MLHEASSTEISKLKKEKKLEMSWACYEGDFLYFYEKNDCICAVVRVAEDPNDKFVLWIEEFEVIREYRNSGIGKEVIQTLIEEFDYVIKLLAMNRKVAEFWEKCGFVYEYNEWDEIRMVYSR